MLTDEQLHQRFEQMLSEGSTMTDEEFLEESIRGYNELIPDRPLLYYDCPICKNKGQVAYDNNGEIGFKTCECSPKRMSLARLAKSGLKDMLGRYTFASYRAEDEWQRDAVRKASLYADIPSGWFVASGTPGTGKTHICTAVCGRLIDNGLSVRYFMWREEAPMLKAAANTMEYEERTRPYKEVDALYIDDFLKGRVTDGDINLAFDIINARYNDARKLTIISTEKTMEEIMDIDSAIGSRIMERKCVLIDTKGKRNWRLSM